MDRQSHPSPLRAIAYALVKASPLVATVVLITLKLTGVISASWWAVTICLWLPAAVCAGCAIVVCVLIASLSALGIAAVIAALVLGAIVDKLGD